MSLYNEPTDIAAHLRQLEVNSGFSGYDHAAPKQNSWRLERDSVKMTSCNPGRTFSSRLVLLIDRYFINQPSASMSAHQRV